MEVTIVDQQWDPVTQTGYRIEKKLGAVQRIKLQSRDAILNEFRTNLCERALKNWSGFIEHLDELWTFFDLKSRAYSRVSMEYFVLKRAYPPWTTDEITSIMGDHLIKMQLLPGFFQQLATMYGENPLPLPSIMLWGVFQTMHPNYYNDCVVCLNSTSKAYNHSSVSNEDMGCAVARCSCERNVAVFVPCGHAICADPCYRGLIDKRRCPICRQLITTMFTTKDLELPVQMGVLFAPLFERPS